MKVKPTVTLATSAYNEEANISTFLHSVIAQIEEGFILEKILVISDGSTDETVKIAKSFNRHKIIVKNYRQRMGKSMRLNGIYASLTSDILVQSDCDIVFGHERVVRDLIKPLIKNPDIGMCGGNPHPVQGETYIEKAINYMNEIFINFRDSVNVFSADGRLLAYKKELVKKIKIPKDMIANDVYTYYCCLTLGYRYKFVKSAVVYFRSPQTLNDHIKQNIRFSATSQRMKKYFDQNLINKETFIPRLVIYRKIISQLIKHPFPFVMIYFISKYCQYMAKKNERKLSAIWDIAYTTKTIKVNYD